jgi:hypothetical protein
MSKRATKTIAAKTKAKTGLKPAKPSISPSARISARIKELGDWRGEMLARVRAILKQADLHRRDLQSGGEADLRQRRVAGRSVKAVQRES